MPFLRAAAGFSAASPMDAEEAARAVVARKRRRFSFIVADDGGIVTGGVESPAIKNVHSKTNSSSVSRRGRPQTDWTATGPRSQRPRQRRSSRTLPEPLSLSNALRAGTARGPSPPPDRDRSPVAAATTTPDAPEDFQSLSRSRTRCAPGRRAVRHAPPDRDRSLGRSGHDNAGRSRILPDASLALGRAARRDGARSVSRHRTATGPRSQRPRQRRDAPESSRASLALGRAARRDGARSVTSPGPRPVPGRSGHDNVGRSRSLPEPLSLSNALRAGTARGPALGTQRIPCDSVRAALTFSKSSLCHAPDSQRVFAFFRAV